MQIPFRSSGPCNAKSTSCCPPNPASWSFHTRTFLCTSSLWRGPMVALRLRLVNIYLLPEAPAEVHSLLWYMEFHPCNKPEWVLPSNADVQKLRHADGIGSFLFQ